MSFGEKGISRVVVIAAVVAILAISFGVYLILSSAPQEFVIKADKVVMDNWRMEPATYKGCPVTKITVQSTEIYGLRLSPLGIYAERCIGNNLVMYAVYNEGTVHGLTSGWAGSDVPSSALEILLPRENAVMENVIMRILYQEAEHMKLEGVTILSPSPEEPFTVTMPQVGMRHWNFEGPVVYTHPDGGSVKATKISAETIDGLLSLKWKNYEQTASSTQKNALVYVTYSAGSAMGFTMSWNGDQEPPELKSQLGDPATMSDVEQHIVCAEMVEIELDGLELKIL